MTSFSRARPSVMMMITAMMPMMMPNSVSSERSLLVLRLDTASRMDSRMFI